MYKAGLLPAPVIQPLRYDTIGTRIKVGPNTYIQIKTDVRGALIYFTTDGTKPDPFQYGRTGKASTHKYIGPFRLQLGNRIVKAILVSRDRLRESPISTRYIDVVLEKPSYSNSDHEVNYSSSSGEDEPNYPNEFANRFPKPISSNNKRPTNNDYAEIEGSIEGPINPINYSGTQINVWGIPAPELANLFDNKRRQQSQPNVGYLTDQMIKNLSTPRAIENEKKPQNNQNDMSNLPESLRKFFKQIQKLYERDTDFQSELDNLIENAQVVKSVNITEKYDSFGMNIVCAKFLVDEPPPPKPKPKPIISKPWEPNPEIQIFQPTKKPASPPRSPSPSPPPTPPPPRPEPAPPQPIKKPEPAPPINKPEPPAPIKKPEEPSVYVEELQQQGTVVDAPNFNPEKDADALRNSVKGLGTKESVIIEIIGNRSNAQRLKIKDTYKAMFGRDLVDDLKSDTSGNFKKLLVALLMSPIEYDCVEIRKAIQGLGTDNSALIEILTSRSNKRIKEMSQLYFQLFKKKMEDEIQSDASGAYRKLLTSLLTASRPETNEVDMNLVREDVDELIKAGIKKWGTDESRFNVIFGTRSFAHLRQVFEEYQRKVGKSIEDSIKSEMSGSLAKTYLALINNIRNRPAYFAKEIKKAIKGLGTDEHTLNRIIVSRCEIDTKQIKEEFQKLFKTSMEKDIQDDVSGDYGKLLLLLLKNPSDRTYDNGESAAQPEEPHVIEQVEEPKIEETPTLVPFANFDPNSDSERLRKAMKGLGTDEKTIIEILGHRSNSQRQELKKVFKQMFGRDLVDDLHSELSGSFRDTIEAMMNTPTDYDAASFREAVKGLGTDESALIELLTTRSSEEINAARAAYKTMFGRDLEADIKSDTSGHFRNVLVSLLTASRPTGNMVDKTQARIDAQDLIKAGVKKWGTDESKFVTIFCTRSYSQLRALFEEYKEQSGHSLEEDLKKEMSGDLLKSLTAIVECVRDKQTYFANLLIKSMKGLGTKESVLIRVVVSRSEIDMVQIKQKFKEISKSTLADYIKGDTSGDFLKILLTLIHEESLIKKK